MYWTPCNSDSHRPCSFDDLSVIACRQYHSTDGRYWGIITFQTPLLTYWWRAEKFLVKHVRWYAGWLSWYSKCCNDRIQNREARKGWVSHDCIQRWFNFSVNERWWTYIFQEQRPTTYKWNCRLRRQYLEEPLERTHAKTFYRERMNCIQAFLKSVCPVGFWKLPSSLINLFHEFRTPVKKIFFPPNIWLKSSLLQIKISSSCLWVERNLSQSCLIKPSEQPTGRLLFNNPPQTCLLLG